MSVIHENIIKIEPLAGTNGWLRAIHLDGSYSAVFILPKSLSAEQNEQFLHQAALMEQAVDRYDAAIPGLKTFGYSKEEAIPYIETDWVEGNSLDEKWGKDVTLPYNEALKLTEQLSRILTICHGLDLTHGNISRRQIVWETKRGRYVLVNFLPHTIIETAGNEHLTIQQEQLAEAKRRDLHQTGSLLYKLITGNTIPKGTTDNNLKSVIEKGLQSSDQSGTGLHSAPWLVMALYRSLTNEPAQRFRHIGELYDVIIKNNKPVVAPEKFYRSQPQQPVKPVIVPVSQPYSKAPVQPRVEKIKTTKKLPASVNPWIAIGLVALIALAVWLLANQGKVSTKNDDDLAASGQVAQQSIDTGLAYSEQETVAEEIPKPAPKKPEKKVVKKTPPPVKDSMDEKETTTDDKPSNDASKPSRVYTVRSKAYFHNNPDPSTRRNAFIVHWNNARLRPIREENGFVYIEYTNVEGQTSKGWLAKKDLVEVEE